MKKIIIPILGLVLLVGGFLIGRVTAPTPKIEPTVSPADTSAPISTEPQEPEEPIETEPSMDEVEQPEPEVKIVYLTTFYADVVETEKRLVVQGHANNSVQYREDSQFILAYTDETEVKLNGQPASIDDIAIGDRVSIHFSGPMLESDPVTIEGILFINIFRE